MTPAPIEPVYACAIHRSDWTYGTRVRGAKGAAAALAVNGGGVETRASTGAGDPARKARGTISNAKRVTSASLGTPQPYFAARSLVKYPPIPFATSRSLAADRGTFHANPPRAFSLLPRDVHAADLRESRRCALASVTGSLESGAKV